MIKMRLATLYRMIEDSTSIYARFENEHEFLILLLTFLLTVFHVIWKPILFINNNKKYTWHKVSDMISQLVQLDLVLVLVLVGCWMCNITATASLRGCDVTGGLYNENRL